MNRLEYLQLRNSGDIDGIVYEFYKEQAKIKNLDVYAKDLFLNAVNLWGTLNSINVVRISTKYFDNLFTVNELSLKGKLIKYF